MQTFINHSDHGQRDRSAAVDALERVMHAIASAFKPRPDLSLANAKFTDALERELADRAYPKQFR
jgi:hypothetical protein